MFRKALRAVISICVISSAFFTFTVQSTGVYTIIPVQAEDIVKLTVCADDCKCECRSMLISFGHAFFVAENLTDNPIDIYGYTLEPYETITFSWWAVDKHMGVWFNIESGYINLANRYQNLSSISTYLDSDEVDALTEFMSNNDFYTPLSNCSKQVIRCWNVVAESQEHLNESGIMTPAKLIEGITLFDESCSIKVKLNNNICFMRNGVPVTYTMEV